MKIYVHMHTQNKLDININSSFTLNGHNWQIIQESINRRMDKQVMIYAFTGILLSLKRGKQVIPWTIWMNLKILW